MIPDSLQISCVKSRFSGFFAFLLLSACQPAVDSQSELMQRGQHNPAIAVNLATQRLANGEHSAALHWFRHAASLGDPQALLHALQLQQRQQSKLATALWLQQQVNNGVFQLDAIAPSKRAELGLWQGLEVPYSTPYTHPQGCQLTLQPVATQQAGVERWHSLLGQWRSNKQLSQLPVCFSAIVTVNSTELLCSEESNTLLRCDYSALNNRVATGSFSQLLVIAGRGKASYNNGIVQIPDNANLALLQHEFMHVLGFIDEYRLAEHTASEVCKTNVYYPNLVMAENISGYLKHWQLKADDISLTAVPSCHHESIQAYRVVPAVTAMGAYEMELPDLYLTLAKRILEQPEKLMPVQYYFAYLARKNENWSQWQQFMQQASDWGYAEAQQALAP